ncbi:TauD/TfdA-like domain [Dillenia turbinata]|uniref:TauD/TfdA-like domain n=1 Tax=Dillenia turbinata TaxID=194707 RepID=A0AAN8YVY5_9MAGN
MSSLFTRTQSPHQKSFNETHFPAILSPPNQTSIKLSDFIQAIKTEKPFLESVLHSAGVILFRGFPVNSASDFNDVVESFGYEEMSSLGVSVPRTHIVGRVFAANEAPPDQRIHFHHEHAYLPEYASKLLFFCEVPPATGGETALVLSHVIYEKMKHKYPDFVEHLENHGVIYTRVYGEDDDPSSPIGRGWKSTFLTNDKKIAEERATKLGVKLQWTKDGAEAIASPVPAIKFDETRQRKIWFNSIAVHWALGKRPTFGDGKPLPVEIMNDYLEILEECCVAIPWEKGDVMMVDNLAVLHSRRPFDSPRRILASLCK